MTIFNFPRAYPTLLLLYPGFNITRILFILTMSCGNDDCVSNLSMMDDELINCIVFLYVTSVIYTILGIYLYEVLPQQFGVRKNFLFLFPKLKKANRIHSHDIVSTISSDDELANEIKNVKEAIKEKHQYPLIVENLTKVTPFNLGI
jgi:hypothetical protein